MKIIFFGTPHFVTPILKSLAEHFEVVGVVTAPDSIEGRKKMLTPSPVKQFCTENIPTALVLTPQQLNNLATEQLKKLNADLFVVAAYGKILPKEVLDIPKFGSINVHPSLLPKYRGPSPIQSAIVKGEKISGVSIIKMDEQVDHGQVIVQWEEEVKPDDTFESLHDRLFKQTAAKLQTIINDYVGGKVNPSEQDHTKATFCLKITREDGFVDITKPVDPVILDRMVRAYYPWPTAYTKLRLKNDEIRIIKFLPNKMIQVEGKNPTSLKDFLNGYPQMKETIEKLGLL